MLSQEAAGKIITAPPEMFFLFSLIQTDDPAGRRDHNLKAA
jgi:hypothetical protein